MDKSELPQNWLKEGWNHYLDYYSIIIPAILLFKILTLATPLLIWKFSQKQWYTYPYMIFIAVPLEVGLNLYFIKLARNQKPELRDIFEGFGIYQNAIIVPIAFGLMVIGGTIMLIIPGMILLSMYGFSEYAVIDKKTNILDSFKYSARITYGYKSQIIVIFILAGLIQFFSPSLVTIKPNSDVLLTNFKFWPLILYSIITFIFAPWMQMTIAKIYIWLSGKQPSAANQTSA